ncbi:hypothetical protein BDN70DRAFT_958870 [Pholiota conissans]|uniref:Uncharacterized protein n=1 Tax=Pholiota conissans TaxID=109636 RepID=A0A9P5YS64_9AGAR|nr:hypothetical protein BDN70DRAFT_958870 [Pholiota conissans]
MQELAALHTHEGRRNKIGEGNTTYIGCLGSGIDSRRNVFAFACAIRARMAEGMALGVQEDDIYTRMLERAQVRSGRRFSIKVERLRRQRRRQWALGVHDVPLGRFHGDEDMHGYGFVNERPRQRRLCLSSRASIQKRLGGVRGTKSALCDDGREGGMNVPSCCVHILVAASSMTASAVYSTTSREVITTRKCGTVVPTEHGIPVHRPSDCAYVHPHHGIPIDSAGMLQFIQARASVPTSINSTRPAGAYP